MKKTNETSTREQPMAWFNSFPSVDQQMLTDKYFNERHRQSLTSREVEEIWRKETMQEDVTDENQSELGNSLFNSYHSNEKQYDVENDRKLLGDMNLLKPNQKKYSQEEVDRLLDQQAARTTSQVLKNNPKQFQIAKNSTYGSDSKNHPINRKQFVEFNESLFQAYIDKFSDEDKVKAVEILLNSFNKSYKIQIEDFITELQVIK